MEKDTFKVAYERERRARLKAEELLEGLSLEVFAKNKELETALARLQQNQQVLIQQEKMASVGMLAAGVAHEINTPLAYSLSNLNVLTEYIEELNQTIAHLSDLPGLPDEARAALTDQQLHSNLQDMTDLTRETLQGLDTMREIVTDLRASSRSDAANRELHDINKGLQRVLNLLRNELRHNVELHIQLAPLPEIYCHPGRLNQVLSNLILNALQAMDHRGHLYITSWHDDTQVHIEIGDDGPGIPESIRKDIFSPFFTTKPVGEGTGLGLSICYGIITEEMNGILRLAESGHGSGANFVISLPIDSRAAREWRTGEHPPDPTS